MKQAPIDSGPALAKPGKMPRTPFINSNFLPYHITARCLNQEWFLLSPPDLWELYSDYIYLIHKMYDIQSLSFVLMSNHFHWIVRTPNGNLPEAMNYFMRETSRQIARSSDRINQIYGTPYRRCLIKTNAHFFNAYRYVYRNPVDAGLCLRVEDYPYSTLQGLLGFQKLIIPLQEDTLLFECPGPAKTLEWLNSSFAEEERKSIRINLKKASYGEQGDEAITLPY